MLFQLGPSEKKKEELAISYIQKADYDRENDILYIKFGSTKSSFGDEATDGIVVFRDLFTDDVTGLTVFYPRKRHDQRIRELKALGFSVNIDSMIQ